MIDLLTGDALHILKTLPDGHFHCCVTSPPYYGLRDYGTGLWRGGDPDCSHSPADTDGKRGLGTSGLEGSLSCTGHQQEGYGARCRRCGAVRDDRQIGFEPTCPEYIDAIVAVMDEVRRVLRPDGNLFLNLGDFLLAIFLAIFQVSLGNQLYCTQLYSAIMQQHQLFRTYH